MENNKRDYQLIKLLIGTFLLFLGIGLFFIEQTEGIAPLLAGFGLGVLLAQISIMEHRK